MNEAARVIVEIFALEGAAGLSEDTAATAAQICGTASAQVSLVGAERQCRHAGVGPWALSGPNDESLCAYVAASGTALVVAALAEDARFAHLPAVQCEPGIRFYAGVPLRVDSGVVVGALSVSDRGPVAWSDAKQAALEALSQQLTRLLGRATAALRTGARLDTGDEYRYRRFFDLSLDLLCIAGWDGYLKKLNPRWEQVLGIPEAVLLSKPFIEFIHPDDREHTLAEAEKLATGKLGAIGFENRYLCGDGSYKWLLWNTASDAQNNLLIGAAHDISKRKQMEVELARAKDSAERASRAKSSFLATMSHELRTPMNSILGFTHILRRNERQSFSAKEVNYLNRVYANGEHLLTLINDVLDLSKIEAHRLELVPDEVDLVALLSEITAEMESGASAAECGLKWQPPAGEVAKITVDRQRFKQVVINLLGNAIKFGAGAPVELALLVDGAGVATRVDVIDAGVGIPPHQREHIFEPFQQADGSTARYFGGSGLGLSIAKNLCIEMGFTLLVDSVLGEGSVFSILLTDSAPVPMYMPPSGSARHLAASRALSEGGTQPGRFRGRNVLIIDDEADSRAVLEEYLDSYGVQVLNADSGELGLQLARSIVPDMIILDLMMADMNGWEVLREVKADPHLCAIPVLVCSIVGRDHHASLDGVAAVIDKPVSRRALSGVLERLLGPASHR